MVVNGAGSTDFSEELTPRNLRREALRLATEQMKWVNKGGGQPLIFACYPSKLLSGFFLLRGTSLAEKIC